MRSRRRALAIAVDAVRDGKGALGGNAASSLYQDLAEAGAVDPTKVVRVALQDAASVASLMLTTEALIAERPQHGTTTSNEENS